MTAHSIAEHDDVRMLSDLGYNVFSIGAYSNPRKPGDDKRPPLLYAPYHPELEALCADQMAAKSHLPEQVIEWSDVIIAHHYLDSWIIPQWHRIRHKRVVWRTCGQSDPRLERAMMPLRADGLTIVRYSPAEQRHFERVGAFAGQDALIRFGKYPDDYGLWNGRDAIVANVTQDMAGRGEHCGLTYYLRSTEGLPAHPAGPGSEKLPGGLGGLTYPGMLSYLRGAGAYLYTGTVPASYTLGLMEALLVGVPVVSIGGEAWMGPADLFEGDELSPLAFNDPLGAKATLQTILRDRDYAESIGKEQRERAVQMFDVGPIGRQWVELLGAP